MSTKVLLQDFPLTLIDLYELKCLSYTSFITDLLKKLNENIIISTDRWTRAYLERIEYPDTSLQIDIPDFANPGTGDLIYQFDNKKGFTKGHLLYEIAKVLPKKVKDDSCVYWEGLVREDDHFLLRLR